MKKRGIAPSSIRTCSRDVAREIRRNPVPATLSLRAPDASYAIRRSPRVDHYSRHLRRRDIATRRAGSSTRKTKAKPSWALMGRVLCLWETGERSSSLDRS